MNVVEQRCDGRGGIVDCEISRTLAWDISAVSFNWNVCEYAFTVTFVCICFLFRQVKSDVISSKSKFDYLSEIQDILLKMDGNCDYSHILQLGYNCSSKFVIPESSASEILVLLGEELIATCCHGLTLRAFQCLGGDFQEFLGTLDGVHDVLKMQDGVVADTEFICAGPGELIFTTERPVIAWLLLGSLKALMRVLYAIDVSVTIEPTESDSQCYRYLFALSGAIDDEEEDEIAPIAASADLKMNPNTFCKAFPWHFFINDQLELIQMGRGFSKLFKSSLPTFGRLVTTYFDFKRPAALTLSFKEIIKRSNTPFTLSCKAVPGKKETISAGLEIKGRMEFCTESNTILFIGSPLLHGLDGLTCNGLFISDIPLHDATREVILVGEQTKAQDGLRRRMDKLKNSIEEGNAAVAKERKKNVSLLYLIFPAEIAESLWLGMHFPLHMIRNGSLYTIVSLQAQQSMPKRIRM